MTCDRKYKQYNVTISSSERAPVKESTHYDDEHNVGR